MMKKTLKNQILELLNLLNEGITYIEQSKNATNELKLQVLQDCQACILPIKNSIIGNERAKKSLALMDGIETNLKKMQILLQKNKPLVMISFMSRKQILKIKEIVMQLNNRKEVVFLPYNASMWDSLESIWQAADKDENCDAYVVPIPYCDRNPDGSAKNWHYEGHDLPSYVPITNWQEYDLSKHRPDVIYIHNPYDDYNLVTSVHPNYYSRELNKYTDMLVYVPYFVSDDGIDPIKCKAPGVVNANKVIVESELIKAQYEANYPEGNPPDGKFLALGSPKFDKVRNSKKEDFTIPKQWEKIVNGKKIILYLTTIETMLLDTESFIKKHRYVFSVFKDRKDVVLWWRPHPLLKSTFESMKPHLLREYEQVVQDYKKAGWGVYDDSSDLNRAIAYSDGYYGDMSSVISLYKATGKPIMVQSLKQNEGLYFDYMEIDENNMWFIPLNYNGLFKMSLDNGNIEFMGGFPGEQLFSSFRYRTLKRIDNKIIIIPWFGDSIIEYDINKKSFKKQLIKVFDNHDINGRWQYNNFLIGMVKYNKYIFMFGFQPVIVRYDFETDGLEYFGEWAKSIDLNYANKNGMMWNGYCIKDNLLFINIIRTNKVLIFNMDTCDSIVSSVGDIKNKYIQINFDGKYFWLLHSNRAVLTRWELEIDRVLEYTLDNAKEQLKDGAPAILKMLLVDKFIYIIPAIKKVTLKIDTKTNVISFIDTKVFHEDDANKSVFKLYCDYAAIGRENEILLMKSSDYSLTIVDKEFKKKQTYQTFLPDNTYEYIFDKAIKMDNFVKEHHFNHGLSNFIDYINKMQEKSFFELEMKKEILGIAIHKKILYQ